MKIEPNKEIEIVRKIETEMKLGMKNSVILIKSQAEGLTNRMEHEEDRLLGLEDEVEESGHSVKESGEILKTHVNGIVRNFETPKKSQIYKLWA